MKRVILTAMVVAITGCSTPAGMTTVDPETKTYQIQSGRIYDKARLEATRERLHTEARNYCDDRFHDVRYLDPTVNPSGDEDVTITVRFRCSARDFGFFKW